MRIIHNLDEMTETARGWLAGGSVGFVSLRSALHAGHLSLIQAARQDCQMSVVSIVENPVPFASDKTPVAGVPLAASLRNLSQELQQLSSEGVDVVFVPRAEDMYPQTFSTYITPTIARIERFQPIHAQNITPTYIYGFATVITKLFQIVRPDVAYFQQDATPEVAVVQKLVQDLNIDVALRILPENGA